MWGCPGEAVPLPNASFPSLFGQPWPHFPPLPNRHHGERGCLFNRTNIFSGLQQAGPRELAPTRK